MQSPEYKDAGYGAQFLCEMAGRLCYMSFGAPRPGGNKAYLDRIRESGHGSVLEHPTWSFIFCSTSRSLTHELVRHRVGKAYSQLSQRYCDESVAEYVVPPELEKEVKAALAMREAAINDPTWRDRNPAPEEDAGLNWLDAVQTSHDQYLNLVKYLLERNLQQAYERFRTQQAYERFDATPLTREEWQKTCTAEEKTELRKAARGAARSVLPERGIPEMK